MEIVDVNAWTGPGMTWPLPGSVDQVYAALTRIGVTRICLSPMDAVWCHDPHARNEVVYQAASEHAAVLAVPVLDPTVATWREHLELATNAGAPFVKLLPAYSGYQLPAAEPLWEACERAGLAVMVQVRLEDPRHHHPMAQVPDFAAAEVVDLAARRPGLQVILGGAALGVLVGLAARLGAVTNLWADVSQVDGMDALARLEAAGWLPRLLFGSHAPLFEPLAALARVLPELDDERAARVLGGNAVELLGPRLGR